MGQGTRQRGRDTSARVAAVAMAVAAAAAGPATRPPPPAAAALPAGAVRRLGELRFGVDGAARGSAAISPDGRHAAVADAGGASVWDLLTGERTAVVRPAEATTPDARMPHAFGVAYASADTLAVALTDRVGTILNARPRTGTVTVVLADADAGAVLRRVVLAGSDQPTGGDDWRVAGPVDGLGGPVVSADGRRVAFAAGRRSVLLYDLGTGRLVADLGPPAPAVEPPRVPFRGNAWPAAEPPGVGHRPLFSGDGRRLVVTAADGRATVYDADTGQPIGDHAFPAGRSASLSADGRLLATVAGDGVVHLFDTSDGHELDLPADVRGAAAAPDPTPAPAAGRPGRRRYAPPAVRTGAIHVTFAPVGGRLAVARVESVPPSTAPATVPPPTAVTRAARVPLTFRLTVLDTAVRPPRVAASSDLPAGTDLAPVWSADGRVVGCGTAIRGVAAFDAGTGRRMSPAVTPGTRLTSVAVSPDGRAVAIADAAGGLRVVDADTNAPVAYRPLSSIALRAYQVDDLRYTTAAADGQPTLMAQIGPGLYHLDPRTLNVRRTLPPDADAGRSAGIVTARPPVYSADGRWSAETDGASVALVNPVTDAVAASFAYVGADGRPVDEAFGTPINATFSADDRRLVVRTTAGMQVADVPTGKFGRPIRLDDPLRQAQAALVVSPDGAWVATGGGGQPLRTFSTDAVLRGTAEPAWTADLSQRGTTSAPPWFSDDSAWVVVHTPVSGDRFTDEWGVAVYEAATGRHVFDLPADSFAPVRFAAGRPLAMAGEPGGSVLVWDLRAVIAATGPAPAAGRSDGQLWSDLADPDPATALRAGFALLDRGRIPPAVGPLAPVATTPTTGPSWSGLVADLSSPVRQTKEAAHKRLEAGGPPAAAEVLRALATHPGGEAEARLSDIARLQAAAGVRTDGDAASAEPAEPESNAVRDRRAAQLRGWAGVATTRP